MNLREELCVRGAGGQGGGQAGGERQPRQQGRLHRVVEVGLARPDGADRRFCASSWWCQEPRSRSIRYRSAYAHQVRGQRRVPRSRRSAGAAPRPRRSPRPPPSASGRGPPAGRPSRWCRRSRRPRRPPSRRPPPGRTARSRPASSQSGACSPSDASRCSSNRDHSRPCPTVAPYGWNGSSGRSRVVLQQRLPLGSKCSGIRQRCGSAKSCDHPVGDAQRALPQTLVAGGVGGGQQRLDGVHVAVHPAVGVEPGEPAVPGVDEHAGVGSKNLVLPDAQGLLQQVVGARAARPAGRSEAASTTKAWV